MSGEDRDAAALVRRRSPALGVPVVEPQSIPVVDSFEGDDHLTPVAHVIERISRTFVPSERERTLIHLFWEHTANMEMRGRKRSDSSETSTLRKAIDALETAIVDIRGERGDNGKLGELKRRVDVAESRRWWAVTFLAGLAVAVVTAAIAFGVWKGSIETDVDNLKARAFRVRNSLPEYPAAKETP